MVGFEQSKEKLATEVGKEQFQSTESDMKKVRDLHLASLAEIALMQSTDTYGLDLGIRADESRGAVVIDRGAVLEETPVLDDTIRAALGGVKEIKNVRIEGLRN